MKRVLGVDLGLKRTGLAVSDELGISARALATLSPKSRKHDVDALVALVLELDVGDVVIGLASLPSGDDGKMAVRARGFAEALRTALSEPRPLVRVHLVDEQRSSIAASKRLVAAGVKKNARKAALDGEVARGLVLEFVDGAKRCD